MEHWWGHASQCASKALPQFPRGMICGWHIKGKISVNAIVVSSSAFASTMKLNRILATKLFLLSIICRTIHCLRRFKVGLFGKPIKLPFSSILHHDCPTTRRQLVQDSQRLLVPFSFRGGSQEASLDEKIQTAMEKLGLKPPSPASEESCPGGACPIPPPPPPQGVDSMQDSVDESLGTSPPPPPPPPHLVGEDKVVDAATSLAESMNVDYTLALAALSATSTEGEGGRVFNVEAARSMVQQELDVIDQIPADSPLVEELVAEGYDKFLSRRALAFAEGNMDDARAILLADKEDEEQQESDDFPQPELPGSVEEEPEQNVFPTVTVDTNIDPTLLPLDDTSSAETTSPKDDMPSPAKKADVVFESKSEEIQELVLESPVPVLLDVYADW